jgi:hypothetical protein
MELKRNRTHKDVGIHAVRQILGIKIDTVLSGEMQILEIKA